jgi:hypothetical protein
VVGEGLFEKCQDDTERSSEKFGQGGAGRVENATTGLMGICPSGNDDPQDVRGKYLCLYGSLLTG